MGTEALWIPAVLSAVGAGVQGYSSYQANKSQDEAAAQGIRTQDAHQRDADARVAQEVTKLQSSSPEDSQRQATDAFMDQLKRTRSQAHGADTVGNTSDQFNADSASATADVDKYGANRAGVLGRINAPGLQRTAEGISRLRAGSDLGVIGRASAGDEFLTQLRARSIRPNPWTQAAGQVIGGIGSGMASNGAYGEGATPVPKGGVRRYDQPVAGFTRGAA